MQLSQRQKTFSELFFALLECILNCEHFQKKDDSDSWCISEFMDSEKWLDNCLKSRGWEDPSTSNMVNGPKLFGNLIDNTFTVSFDHWEGNWVGQNLS